MRPLGVDLRCSDLTQREQRRNQQQDGDDKDGSGGQEVSAGTHGGCRQAVANGGKTGIASQSLADRGMTNEAKADRHHGRAEDATCQRLYDRRRQHHRKHRMRCIGQSADTDPRNRDAGYQTFRPCGID